jgi:hypothetical protein
MAQKVDELADARRPHAEMHVAEEQRTNMAHVCGLVGHLLSAAREVEHSHFDPRTEQAGRNYPPIRALSATIRA